MLISCEKCSTTYELEERLIPPGGAPVQCSRCEHVFRAYPPSRNGQSGPDRRGLELVPPPANDPPVDVVPGPQLDLPVESPEPVEAAPEAREAEPAPEPAEEPAPPVAAEPARAKTPAPVAVVDPRGATPGSAPYAAPPPSPAAHERGPTGVPTGAATYKPPPGPVIPPGKPVRKVPNPELDGTDTASVAPMPRKAVSFDVKPRKRGKSSWIVNGAVGLLALILLAGAFSWWQERRAARAPEQASSAAPSRAATRERQDALKLLMRDDAASMERAAAQLDDVVRREPASAARADRALALALLSQQAKDQADRLESRARTLDEERGRAEGGGGDGAARSTDLATEAENARAEISPLQERAGRLLSEARAELDALHASSRSDVSTSRARAWIQLVAGERDAAGETARRAPEAANDPWLALAAIVAEIRDGATGDAHQRAADRLEQLAGKHPEFVRPLVLAGRIRAGLGDGERALADLDAALKLNPQHAEARRVRAEIAPAIPESSSGEAPAAASGDAPTRDPSPAVNGHSQGGKAPAAQRGR